MLALRYYDPYLLFLTTYPTAVLSWLGIIAIFIRLLILQKKAVRIINFQPQNFHISPLFKQNTILKFPDKICSENVICQQIFKGTLTDI